MGRLRARNSKRRALSRRVGPREGRSRNHLRAEPRRMGERGARDPSRRRRDGADLPGEHGSASSLRCEAFRRARPFRRHEGAPREGGRDHRRIRQRRAVRPPRRFARSGCGDRGSSRSGPRCAVGSGSRRALRHVDESARHRRCRRRRVAFRGSHGERRFGRRRHDALHERHDRPSEGRPAHPRQRRRQRGGLARRQCAAPDRGNGRLALAPHEPRLRFRRSLPRQHARFHELRERAPQSARGASRRATRRLHERPRILGETGEDVRRTRRTLARSHGRPPRVLPLRGRGPLARREGVLPLVRAPHHRGLRPHRSARPR